MQVFTAEKLVHSSCQVFFVIAWEPPAGITLWIWLYYGYVDELFQPFEVSDEIYTMSEWTEQAYGEDQYEDKIMAYVVITNVKVISVSLRGKLAIVLNLAMPGVVSPCFVDFWFVAHGTKVSVGPQRTPLSCEAVIRKSLGSQ